MPKIRAPQLSLPVIGDTHLEVLHVFLGCATKDVESNNCFPLKTAAQVLCQVGLRFPLGHVQAAVESHSGVPPGPLPKWGLFPGGKTNTDKVGVYFQ